MPRTYRPRPLQNCICAHCAILFQTNHSRTKYCGDSCRVKAYYARHSSQAEPTKKLPGNLKLTPENVGVTAVGALVGGGAVAVVNYFANDLPLKEQLIEALTLIHQENRFAFNQLLAVAQEQSDHIDAMKELNPSLQAKVSQLTHKRRQKQQLESAKEEQKRAIVAKKFGPK